ncbi:ATP-dependent Clp protease ATP-binding subunit ClpA [Leptospira gomenensis]|uniref:ATP-dependent Clp protease ATP-binding subunit ClpA n=1 Tax=Leptospira gomenensis TaxID=2484974 RepID=A0A5F1YSS0_9LEPT|nr:ATP-dependent Clp protease ATP-binding subunit ClpA [Leptospira gomenensis]TGK35139.1 ATP-dependent Clp protease ATP-binding subunit ClpA [Leptospira gomenensis]TGK35845.1 ATP-dependent Clp protease ATP-binding subunit ClpA [Leptospira gomenensis]TGK44030.1 ATP-dependent Clp protease ATP-binding subunit ClpA [Leptospira gomenensis]TGK61230.1 ATP-dependent Clp protease ATP-binding subunit ClpA [Leptospira gomenensis]
MILTEEMERTLKKAWEEAKKRRNEFITLEHILLAITFDGVGQEVLEACGADLERLRQELSQYLDRELESFPESSGEVDPIYTIGVQHVLQLAEFHVQSTRNKKMDAGDVLAALFREDQSNAVYFLGTQDVSRLDIVRYISHGIRKDRKQREKETINEDGEKIQDPLRAFCVDLTAKAREGKLDPMVGREDELDRTIHILCRRRKNNPIFVGEAGVGKTSIVEGLAQKVVDGKVPEPLKNLKVYSLDMGLLLAGTKFRGEFEERLKNVVTQITSQEDHVLFIDEIHTIIGAGAVSGGSLDASNLLKPALSSGELRCIGTTTYKEYKSIFEKDHALSRRFQKVEVGEPSVSETVEILKGLLGKYESFHRVKYSASAVEQAAELSARYILDRKLPDKAIDLLDEAGARVRLRENGKKTVTVREIEELVSKIAKVPSVTVKADDREKLKNLDQDLKQKIFGQDSAIDQLVQSIRLSRSGLSEPGKPVGSFLFAGPTGVGKTELTRKLAEILGVELVRFDMSEYMEKHTVSRLIGSPPGYVGFEQGGQLTDAVYRNPHCVLLLDEIEKAHEDIYNILLQIMDHATLTDNNGRKSDFRQVILVMTTNTGARERATNPVGFGNDVLEDRSTKAIERQFSPEFRNRLTAVIEFSSLNPENVTKVVAKQLALLQERLNVKQIELEFQEDVLQYVATQAYTPEFGARPVQRWLDTHISKRISEEILFGILKAGGRAKLKAGKDGIEFEFFAGKKS